MSELSTQEILLLLNEAHAAIKKADAFVDKVIKLGVDAPQSLTSMMEPTLKIKATIIEEIAKLEAAYENAVRRS